MKEDIINRFENSYEIVDNGCWEWLLSNNFYGYGQFRVNYPYRKLWRSHRFAYALYRGELPEYLDHLCRNRKCVNPDHLEATTIKENVLKGNGITAMHAKQSHCHNGHPFNTVNTYKVRNGRDCRICRKEAIMRSKYRIQDQGGLFL